MADARIVLDRAAIGAVLTGPSAPIAKDIYRRANRVLNKARYLCPVDTGNLRGSLSVQMTSSLGGSYAARVGTNVPYAIYVHEGTRYMQGVPFLRDALDAAR